MYHFPLQYLSTLLVPSAMEAMTWMLLGCPSEETSGSDAFRCIHPQVETKPKHQCRNPSWGKLESKDMRFPSRWGSTTHSLYNITYQITPVLQSNVILIITTFTFSIFIYWWCALFLLVSDANRSSMLSLLTAWAKWCWQGTAPVHFHYPFPLTLMHYFKCLTNKSFIWVLLCCRLVVWTLRLKDTLPTQPTVQMKSLRRSVYAHSQKTLSAQCCIAFLSCSRIKDI